VMDDATTVSRLRETNLLALGCNVEQWHLRVALRAGIQSKVQQHLYVFKGELISQATTP